ncbi:MAG TPA: restriction endonuclease subunit S, partial [Firmicutes bacterium]|nr:restriction endonuclease subunit S [Bacillota bacterium]
MSRLEELIVEFCPDGVEFKRLCNVLTIRNGKDYKGFDVGDIPVYGSGGIIAYVDQSAYDKPSVLIPRKGSIDKLYYVDMPFWTVDTIFYTEINNEIIEPKFVFYFLEAQHIERLNTAGGVPSLTQAVLNKIFIPLPPLPIQREIVRILDNFTELTAELT